NGRPGQSEPSVQCGYNFLLSCHEERKQENKNGSVQFEQESDGKVQTFGKRCQAAKRDPNCPVVIRGWLNKKDSSGLKLWKRRWFVLSNYCLYYYKGRKQSACSSAPWF
ncbi:hypothetical protein CCH79_00015579, partial [Gambusia affinis]